MVSDGHGRLERVAQVLLGQNPKDLPFENVAVEQLVVNPKVAKQLGITFPASILKDAKR